ncbi:Hypothetical protein SMAX5B_022301 [Scophthalmus maximus]|uniref:Uncharacterized protein n=1 Tax=Scophthalmus maximus TaxID=52904 RepID=A0A2U9C2T9_SCOMX|nr:Hypothetical protein SMAX5B_022301 [Scophthalmus maximus]
MVHSGSSSPMKTTPTASSQLTVPATAPLLQVAPPLVPPPGDTSGQALTQTPARCLSTDLTSKSDSTADTNPCSRPSQWPYIKQEEDSKGL